MSPESTRPSPAVLAGIACVSAAVLMVELALTRIFSVTMYYHFAFLAVSIAMFGLSASSVLVYVSPRWHPPERALANLRRYATLFWIVTATDAFILLRLRVGLEYSPENVAGVETMARRSRGERPRGRAAVVQQVELVLEGRGVRPRTSGLGLSATFTGPKPNSLFMDIDSSASTPILEGGPISGPISYLQYEITGMAYAIRPDAQALVTGPGRRPRCVVRARCRRAQSGRRRGESDHRQRRDGGSLSLGTSRPGLLAWAWGINAATSIPGASAAILIAMTWGFTRVAAVHAGIYAAAG